jgi:hypothetical protein
MGEGTLPEAGWTTTARVQEGSPVTWEAPDGPRVSYGGATEDPVQPPPTRRASADARPAGSEKRSRRGRPTARGTRAPADAAGESEGRIRAWKSGNGAVPRSRRSKGGPCGLRTSGGQHDPGLDLDRHVSATSGGSVAPAGSRDVATEEPDGGNLQVRIREGPGRVTGRGYSTTVCISLQNSPSLQCDAMTYAPGKKETRGSGNAFPDEGRRA